MNKTEVGKNTELNYLVYTGAVVITEGYQVQKKHRKKPSCKRIIQAQLKK